jgi:hypothetical protein
MKACTTCLEAAAKVDLRYAFASFTFELTDIGGRGQCLAANSRKGRERHAAAAI